MTRPEDATEASGRSKPVVLHATTVALDNKALVITGPSGSGKSGLALQLLALGADLVSDDQTILSPQADGPPVASAPETLNGMIEARGVGLMAVTPAPPTQVIAVVDLGTIEAARMPARQTTKLAGASVPLLHKVESEHFPAALLQYLKSGECLR